MDRVGVLVVSKCLSATAIIDTIARSESYSPEFYVLEKQLNPFSLARAKVHRVLPDLNVREVARFATKHRGEVAFGLTDTEDFVTAGGRDEVERSGVPMVCVTRRYAVERSKADQRLLFEKVFRTANPRYAIFDPKGEPGARAAVAGLKRFSKSVGGVVIKPDAPARGAGVGVWGSDFHSEEEMVAFFLNVYSKGRVVVEELVEGEESSFQAFSDGKHFIAGPLTRDYKRSLDGNRGALTGGMGSYRGSRPFLPFVRESEWEGVVGAEESAFRRWKGRGSNPGLRGIVLYDALMHTGNGFKVLERNSRGGNTEQVNLLSTMEDDFVDVCYRMIDGRLKGIRFANRASVVTCAVPLSYGTPEAGAEAGARIDLRKADLLAGKSDGRIRIFPMDVRVERGSTRLGSSRSVAVVGIGASTDEARDMSLRGVDALAGPLRARRDMASEDDISRCSAHLSALRSVARFR